jgi:hypothetical protein
MMAVPSTIAVISTAPHTINHWIGLRRVDDAAAANASGPAATPPPPLFPPDG